ncbi:unnamed protein product [Amoebophrya sp. A25]|nr:unnamed protein product [Amoebophrya sp. A25]|eukprot:GSA25T00024954001.1
MLWNSLSFEIEASEEEEAHWRTLEACDLGRGGSSIRRHGGSSFGSSSSPVVDQGSSRSLVGACSKASRWSRSCKSRRRDETASGRPINPLFLKKIFTGTAVVVYLMAAIEMLYLSAHAMDFDTTGALLQEAEEESLRNSVLQLRRQIRKAEKKVKGKEKGENKKEKEEKEKGEQDGKKKEKKEKEDKEQEDEQDYGEQE